MVTIINYQKKTNSEGKEFNVLVLQGNVEFVRSTKNGSIYATARRASITSTFDENVCRELIGTKYPGEIEKIQSEEYEYKIPETGEVITIAHKYVYNPNPTTIEESVFVS